MTKVIQIRDVPTDVHKRLNRLADEAGLSLNRFLLRELERIAGRGKNAEIFRRAQARPGKRPTTDEIVRTIREMRDRD